MIKIAFVGDVVGTPGRRVLRQLLPTWRRSAAIDCVVVNGENAAGGIGLTPALAEELFFAGADAITTGNHVWKKPEIKRLLDEDHRVFRPANYPGPAPGRGFGTIGSGEQSISIMNLEGRIFMRPLDCPFAVADRLLAETTGKIVIVDFHAEASSEKAALAYYLDGRVTAVLGTHTHVPTADQRILPKGTAFVTDVGMTGPIESVIGMEIDQSIERFRTQRPGSFQVAGGQAKIDLVVIAVDTRSGSAKSIERVLLAETLA